LTGKLKLPGNQAAGTGSNIHVGAVRRILHIGSQILRINCSVAHVTRACMQLPVFKKPRAADPRSIYTSQLRKLLDHHFVANAHGGASYY